MEIFALENGPIFGTKRGVSGREKKVQGVNMQGGHV
jgi:hypothetical protein